MWGRRSRSSHAGIRFPHRSRATCHHTHRRKYIFPRAWAHIGCPHSLRWYIPRGFFRPQGSIDTGCRFVSRSAHFACKSLGSSLSPLRSSAPRAACLFWRPCSESPHRCRLRLRGPHARLPNRESRVRLHDSKVLFRFLNRVHKIYFPHPRYRSLLH